jgi:hypothetical protein
MPTVKSYLALQGDAQLTDDFFEFGGHSLLALKIFAQIERKLHYKLGFSALLEAPTVTLLAQTLRDKRSAPASSALVAIQPAGMRLPFFWVFAQGGLEIIDVPGEHGEMFVA